MITALTSPQYVNRVRQDWTANGGVYGDGGVYMATPANNPFAQLGPTLDLVFAGTATDPLDVASTTDDTLSLNFTAEAYQIAAQYAVWGTGGLQAVNFADIVTFTRASTATYFNASGVLTSAGNDEPRFDYDPATLAAQGLLIEEARTNSIRNNTMQGAVAGTPGTLPTNWATAGSGIGTLTREIIGTGTSNGITYIDIRFSGTTSTTGFAIGVESSLSGPAASVGQTWTMSNFFAMVGGSTTNINALRAVQILGREAGGAATGDTFSGADIKSSVTSTLTRFTVSGTVAQATTATLQPMVVTFSFASGVAIDITLRIGLPQLELGAFATSVIPTTTTALTRSADVASVNTLSPWYNATEGTLFAEAQTFSTSGTALLVSIDDTTSSNRIQLRRSFTSIGSGYRMVSSGGSIDVTQISGTLAGVNKLSIAATAGAQTASTNGSTVTGIVSITPMPTVTRLALGDGPGSTPLNGWLRRVTFYPRVLSQSEQNAITT